MKRIVFILMSLVLGTGLFAQEKMYIHKTDGMTLGAPVSETDSIYFSNDESIAFFQIGDTLAQYPVEEIDSINFGSNSSTIYIQYNGDDVSLINPLAFEGVSIFVDGAYVTVQNDSEVQNISFVLDGATSNGMFKIYSVLPFELVLNGLDITNPQGPAINIQSGDEASVVLAESTTNDLTDGVTYEDPPAGEDQKGVFFSEILLAFSGSGTLTINGNGSGKHGLYSDDAIEITNGTINVTSAEKDAVHAKEGLNITGGIIEVTAAGDGIDGDGGSIDISGGSVTTLNDEDDVKGISCDDELIISGGVVNITVTGDQSKGMKSDSPITLSGGTITVHNSGDAVLEASGAGYDPSYCTAIKSNDDIVVSGADITIACSGLAGKGVSTDGNLIISDGSIDITSTSNGATYTNELGEPDAYVSTCLSSDGDMTITGGTVTTNSSGSAGKGFSSDMQLFIGTTDSSPAIDITTTGTKILVSGSGPDADYAEAKAVKSDSAVYIISGTITISSADDGIKSEKSIDINGGTIDIANSVEGLEAPFITVNDGDIHVFSSDDCINTTFGFGGEQDDGSLLLVNGGYIAVSASGGDGLDGNGDMTFTGGTTIVHGPPSPPEVGMDYNGTCEMNGGFLVISGINSNMTQAPGNGSDQYCLKVTSGQILSSTTLFHIQDASGNNILTFQPARNYSSIIFSSEELQTGVTYSIYTGGSCTGIVLDGLYSGGTYSGGTFRTSFTINGTITSVNF